ncbi:hypothetical protein M9H77_18420 [Catharanthus roseus]|uniref:Uncharacterized protein n=1 Tax=Catharanthus roseus TaxID=4058 RepID=A0ACC0B7D6_CATRO|nr:hypothetical protein M9H77_18420 [Catharanthus roseus]
MDNRFHRRRNGSCGRSSQSLEHIFRFPNHNPITLPTLYGNLVPTYYLEWESEVEYLFCVYRVSEDDKDSCDSVSDESIEEEEEIEIERKDRVEEKESLVEESCFFDSMSTLFEEKYIKEAQGEKEQVKLEKIENINESLGKSESVHGSSMNSLSSEVLNPFANETNSSFVSKFSCVHNFGVSRKNQEGRLPDKPIKILNFFPSNSYLCFEIYFKEINLLLLVFNENGDHLYFINFHGTLHEKKYLIKFNSSSCDISLPISRVDDYNFNVAEVDSFVLGVEDKGEVMEKELSITHEDISISFSLNPFNFL